jgi:quinol monooxygenase YgiN
VGREFLGRGGKEIIQSAHALSRSETEEETQMTKCTVIGTVVAKKEWREELQGILMSQIAPTREEPGCINYDFHVAADNSCVFMFYENWRSRADLDTHLKSPHLLPLVSRIDQLLACPVEMKFFEMLSDASQ